MYGATRRRHSLALGALILSAAVVVESGLVVLGWMFSVPILTSISPGLAAMKANTAVAMGSLGIALACAMADSRQIRRWGSAAAVFAGAIGALTLSQFLFSVDLGIDQLLIAATSQPNGMSPGRMAPAATAILICLSASLLMLDSGSLERASRVLALIALGACLLELAGYLYGAVSLDSLGVFRSVSLPTAACGFLLGMGIVMARPDRGVVGLLTSDSAGGLLGRRLLPIAFVFPFAIGWLRLLGQNAGWYGTEFGVTIFASSNVAVFTSVILWNAARLDRADKDLRRSEENFRLAVDAAPHAVVNVDHTGSIVMVNVGAENLFGYRREEMLGRPVEFLLPERFRAAHPGQRAGFFADPKARPMGVGRDLFGLRKDGSEVPIEIGLSPLQTPAGLRVLSSIVDITERKRMEAAFQERARLAALSADVGLSLTRTTSLSDMLQLCAESMVKNLDAAFARVWTFNPKVDMLELRASAGLYTHLDGPHGRIPVGSFKIGRIAEKREPHLTNDVPSDPLISDPEWARREKMVAFAGYPLCVGDRLVGVMAVFARQRMEQSVLVVMGAIANQIALGIERKHAETERDRYLAMLRLQIERMPLGYVLFDEDQRVVEWNPAAETIFGYTKDEVVNRDIFDLLVPHERRSALRQIVQRLQAGDMSAHSVNENRTKDGRIIVCEWINTPLLDHDGKVIGILSLARDITNRIQLEKQVQQAQKRLEEVVVSSPAVLFTLAIAGNRIQGLSWISANLMEMLGYRPEQALGLNWWTSNIHPDDRDRIMEQTPADLFASGRCRHDYRFRHGDGAFRWTHGELRLIRDSAGIPVEVVGAWTDITEQKLLETQFQQAQKMEAVGRLAGGVAHDFNNLLTVIIGFSEMVLNRLPAGDPNRDFIAEVKKSGDRAALLTRQLLTFSRKQVVQPAIIDLNAMLGELDKMLRRLIGEDIDLAVVPGAALWCVNVDPGQMEQVVMNLAVNARDAMPTGGKLTIETANVVVDEHYVSTHMQAHTGEYVLLAVSDNGVGMDAQTRSKIFEPFFTTKTPDKGTGLGLATVFGIVKQSNGHVEVYSEPGLGTTFKVYLPRVREAVPLAAQQAMPLVPKGSETLLVAEDEDGVRALARIALHQKGYKVLEARNGVEALKICEQSTEPIHLLLTDVVMPQMSGRQLAERLAKVRPGMKVLYLSGYTDDAVVRHGVLEAGMPFLQKPFTPDVLAKKVRELLDRDVAEGHAATVEIRPHARPGV